MLFITTSGIKREAGNPVTTSPGKAYLDSFQKEKWSGTHSWEGAGLCRCSGPQDRSRGLCKDRGWQGHWEMKPGNRETQELPQSKEKEGEITVMERYPCSPTDWQKRKSKKNRGAAEGSANRKSGSQLTSSVLSRTTWKYLLRSQMHTQDDPTAPLLSNHLRQLSAHILGRHIPESASQQCNKGTKRNLSTHHQQENSWINREIPILWIHIYFAAAWKQDRFTLPSWKYRKTLLNYFKRLQNRLTIIIWQPVFKEQKERKKEGRKEWRFLYVYRHIEKVLEGNAQK